MYICTHIHKNADCELARVSAASRGCPRVPTGLEKASFFSFSPLENALLRVKNAQKSWLSELLVSGHGRFRIVIVEIPRNTSCSYEYIYVYVYI